MSIIFRIFHKNVNLVLTNSSKSVMIIMYQFGMTEKYERKIL